MTAPTVRPPSTVPAALTERERRLANRWHEEVRWWQLQHRPEVATYARLRLRALNEWEARKSDNERQNALADLVLAATFLGVGPIALGDATATAAAPAEAPRIVFPPAPRRRPGERMLLGAVVVLASIGAIAVGALLRGLLS